MISAKYHFLRETYKQQITDLLALSIRSALIPLHVFGEDDENIKIAEGLMELSDANRNKQIIDSKKVIDTQNAIFDIFAAYLDPTADRKGGKAWKYLHWICAQFLDYRHNDKPMLIEDFYKHRDNLRDFDAWSAQLHRDGQPNQIDHAHFTGSTEKNKGQKNGFHALGKLLRPYQHAREEKRLKNEFRRLSADDRKEIEDGTSILYSGDEGQVLMIHNWAASKYWGTHTEWCITQRDTDEHFHSYHPDNPIIFYLPSINGTNTQAFPDHMSFKYAAVHGCLWDEHDETQGMHFPDCLHRLAIALREAYQDRPECLDFLDSYGRAKMIADDTIEEQPPQKIVQRVVFGEMDYDDFDRVIQMLDEIQPNIDNNHLLPLISPRLRNDPDFLIEALKIQKHTSSYGNVETVRISEMEEFKAYLLNDTEFMDRALTTYGKVYFDLPQSYRQNEEIALRSLAHYPKGIIDILSNITTINNMYSEISDRRLSIRDKQIRFLEKAMIANPSVVEFMNYVQGISASNIPDQAWLNAFDANPHVLTSSMNKWHQWFRRYSNKYNGTMDHQHSPREMVLSAFRAHENDNDSFNTASGEAFYTLYDTWQIAVNDPEVFYYNTLCSKTCYHQDSADILVAACKKDISLFSLFNDDDRQNPRLIREVLTHVIETEQELQFARHLRHLPFSSPKHPETLMSCKAVLRVIDSAFPDLEPWPDFQERIDVYRDAQRQQEALPDNTARLRPSNMRLGRPVP